MAKAKIIISRGSDLRYIGEAYYTMERYCASHDVGTILVELPSEIREQTRKDLWYCNYAAFGFYAEFIRYCVKEKYRLHFVSKMDSEIFRKVTIDNISQDKDLVAILEDPEFLRKELSDRMFIRLD